MAIHQGLPQQNKSAFISVNIISKEEGKSDQKGKEEKEGCNRTLPGLAKGKKPCF